MPQNSYAVKRRVPRFSFIAEAEVTALLEGARQVARISEFSAHGCYVDTLNAFPVGTEVSLRIRHGGSKCEVPGTVIYTHAGYGMGVVFGDLPPEQRAVLDAWLAALARKQS